MRVLYAARLCFAVGSRARASARGTARRSVRRQRLARLLGDERQYRKQERQRVHGGHLGSRRPVEARLDGASDQRADGRHHDGRILHGGRTRRSALSRQTSYLFFSGDWRQDEFSGLRQAGLGSRRLRPQAPRHRAPDARARRRRRRQAVGVDDGRGARRSDRPRRARLRAAHHRDARSSTRSSCSSKATTTATRSRRRP